MSRNRPRRALDIITSFLWLFLIGGSCGSRKPPRKARPIGKHCAPRRKKILSSGRAAKAGSSSKRPGNRALSSARRSAPNGPQNCAQNARQKRKADFLETEKKGRTNLGEKSALAWTHSSEQKGAHSPDICAAGPLAAAIPTNPSSGGPRLSPFAAPGICTSPVASSAKAPTVKAYVWTSAGPRPLGPAQA